MCCGVPNCIEIGLFFLFSRYRISVILNFMGPIMGSLKSRCRTSYRSSIKTIALDCLVLFEKLAFFVRLLATDGQTNGQTRKAAIVVIHSIIV